jgi:uncharacterized membrane protein
MNVELPHLLFRWLHVLSGVMWVGQLWSLVLVQRLLPGEPTDAGLTRFLLRAHNWHRWAATLTWITGIPLLGIVYYGGGALIWPEQSAGLAMGVSGLLRYLSAGSFTMRSGFDLREPKPQP